MSILKTLAEETNGISYNTRRMSLDGIDPLSIDYTDRTEMPLKGVGETRKFLRADYLDLRSQAKDLINEKPLFKYFLDGSRKTYRVDDIAYGDKIFPIMAGQIGVGCCERENSKLKRLKFEPYQVISVPRLAAREERKRKEAFLDNLKKKINSACYYEFIQFNKILSYSDDNLSFGDKYENRGVATIQDAMISKEQELVKEIVNDKLLNAETYLLKDGSLEYNERNINDINRFKNNYRHVVGVSKSFSLGIRFSGNKSMGKMIADLPLFHRTQAIRHSSPEEKLTFSVWFIRLKEPKYCNSPFEGIIKVEKIIVTDEEKEHGIESDDIDIISANLINERNPVCYGSDPRWANHLYPIYLTELYIKSKYVQDHVFLGVFN